MMIRFKLISLLLLASATAGESGGKIHLEKSAPYPTEASFLSRIASWFNPFGSSADLKPEETRFTGAQYLPPPKQCNPCNQSPWIPIASQSIPNYISPPSSQYGPAFRPPQKVSFAPSIENLRPPPYANNPPIRYGPPVTYLKPVGAPIGMLPPPMKGGTYHSLPSNEYGGPEEFLPPPPPPPSDSYGAPVSGANSEFQLMQEFLPISESGGFDIDQPIPLPNLSNKPVLPIRNAGNFRDSLPQQNEIQSIQVVPSIKIADFLSSVEHPINVIQSPLVDVSDDVRPSGFYQEKARFNDNPIVVADTHTAGSSININNKLPQAIYVENSTFTPPEVDYSKWEPTVSTSMIPPAPLPSTWLFPVPTTKPKHKQIVIPYVNKNGNWKVPHTRGYTTLVPVYTPPPVASENSAWSQFVQDYNLAESKKVTATAFTPPPTSTSAYNINDLLKGTRGFQSAGNLPFDVISLQNNIDDWTQQEYAKSLKNWGLKSSTSSAKFVPSKQIPDEYFTTPLYETTSFDYEPASSNQNEKHQDIESNLIYADEGTTEASSTLGASWDATSVTVSPITKEKVYIVTPQTPATTQAHTSSTVTAWSHPPQVVSAKNASLVTPRFLVRLDPENEASREKLKQSFSPLTVVFSEWPHLINNLQTTAKPAAPTPPKHPLLGFMDLSAYTPPPNSTVQTISGHSKVVTAVTPSSAPEKKAE